MIAARSKMDRLPDQKIVRLGELKFEELTLPLATDDERMEAVTTSIPMEIKITEVGANRRETETTEDIREAASRIRTKLIDILKDDPSALVPPLEEVTLELIKEKINNSIRPDNDIIQDSLKYILTRENALRHIAGYTDPIPLEGPVTTLSEMAHNGTPLFVWALAINSTGEAQTAALFSSELGREMSSESKPLAPSGPVI